MKIIRVSALAIGLAGAFLLAPNLVLAQAVNTSQCIGCHEIPGYKSSFPSVYHVPKLYGQSAKYIEAALIAYRKGERTHPTMRGIAGSLSDKDIAALAAHYGSK